MSYEGQTQGICQQGHYFATDAYEEDALCPVCQSPRAWENEVDETNGGQEGSVLYQDLKDKFLVKEEEFCTCSCGHTHSKSEAIFRIPTRAETDPLRKYSTMGDGFNESSDYPEAG